ncbi:MAG: disulfide oxidoreductase [Candidatus Bipolaricaulia bacterium]
MTTFLGRYGLYLGWLVAIVATGGSLYLSEVVGFVPCKLCWLQRIFMYPLAIVLGMASFRQDRPFAIYALPLTVIGGLIALFHYLEQKVPGIGAASICRGGGVPCDAEYINWLGFVTIPSLALIAFVLITACLAFVRRASNGDVAP